MLVLVVCCNVQVLQALPGAQADLGGHPLPVGVLNADDANIFTDDFTTYLCSRWS